MQRHISLNNVNAIDIIRVDIRGTHNSLVISNNCSCPHVYRVPTVLEFWVFFENSLKMKLSDVIRRQMLFTLRVKFDIFNNRLVFINFR